MFKKGDVVKWSSQAAGTTKEKKGTVVRIVRRNDLQPWKIAAISFPKHKRMFDGSGIPGCYAVGYLVEVRDGKTAKAKPKLYLPYPNKLTLVENKGA